MTFFNLFNIIVLFSYYLQEGKTAASLNVAEKYILAFDKLAKTNNTLILPANANDVSSMVVQAMSIYKTINKTNDVINSNSTDGCTPNTPKPDQTISQ